MFPVKLALRFIAVDVPFKGMALLGGFIFIFWIALSYRIAGKGYGVITAVLIASLCLLTGPWFGIASPEWYGVYGLASFLAMGILTERINGGVGNAACLSINWVALGVHHGIWPSPLMGVTFLMASLASGFIGDWLAEKAALKIAGGVEGKSSQTT